MAQTLPDKLLTCEEVADYLRVTVETVRTWVAEKRIPHFRVGRFIRFSRPQLAEWLGHVEQHWVPLKRARARIFPDTTSAPTGSPQKE